MLLSLRESCGAIWENLSNYAGKHPLPLFLSLAACLYLLIVSRAFRKKLLMPIIVLIVMVLNPVLYSLVYGNNNLPFVTSYGLRYWRFFWMMPQAILIGLALADLIRRLPRSWMRCGGLVLASGIIIAAGSNAYDRESVFKPAVSPYKISESAEGACERILADDPEPLCMFDSALCAQAREYSGNIKQVWGRQGFWNLVGDQEATSMFQTLISDPRDWESIFAFAEQRGVTHICFYSFRSDDRKEMKAVAAQHGYEVLDRVGKRFILHRIKKENDADPS